jgi:subtilisin family serine protease
MGRYIVKLRPGVRFENTATGRRIEKARIARRLARQNAVAGFLSEAEVAEMQRSADVEFVEPDPPRRLMGDIVPFGITLVQADQLSDENAGALQVCVIDSGYDLANTDLNETGNPASPPPRITGVSVAGNGPWFEDGCGHGTHVTGTLGAVADGQGVLGVLPNARIRLHIVRLYDNQCSPVFASDVIAALNECRASGANVTNLSLGCDGPGCFSAAEQAAFAAAEAEGMLSVAAAGNGGDSSSSYPASYSSVISVAAVDADSTIAGFSQRNAKVELAAPGVDVLSTVPVGTGLVSEVSAGGNTFPGITMTGSTITSAAGPLVDCGLGNQVCPGGGGQVCLIRRGEFFFSTKAESCEAGGGVAAVVYNNVSGLLFGTLGESTATIPVLGITQPDGEFLLANRLSSLAETSTQPQDFDYLSGTSMATPHVAGIAALVWSQNPDWTAAELRSALAATAIDFGAPGRDPAYGWGLVQGAAALAALQPNTGVPIGPGTVTPMLGSNSLPVGLAAIRAPNNGSLRIERRDLDGADMGDLGFFTSAFEPVQLVGLSTAGAGAGDLAVAALRSSDQRLAVERRTPDVGALVGKRMFFFGAGFSPVWLFEIEDVTGDGEPDLAYLGTRDSDGRAAVEIRDGLTGDFVRRAFFSSGFTPLTARAIADLDSDGSPEIAALMRRGDGRYNIEIRNALGASTARHVFFQAGFTPIDFEIGSDPDGDGVPELAVLATRDTDGRAKVEHRNAFGSKVARNIWFDAGFIPRDLILIGDSDSNGTSEWGVLQLRESDSKPAVEIRNAFGTRNATRRFYFDDRFIPAASFALGDPDGNVVPDLGVVGTRQTDQRIANEIRNSRGDANTRRFFFGP